MIVSVITTSDKLTSEIPTVIQLFKEGLPILHLRKPTFSTKKMREYLDLIPREYHNRIIIHSHHKLIFEFNLKGVHFSRKHLKKKTKSFLKMQYYRMRKRNIMITRSFHHLESLSDNRLRYSFVFLNPFFSKTEPKKNHFDISLHYLKKVISEYSIPVYASGNITLENISFLKDYGVSGVAISKIIWSNPQNAVEVYNSIHDQLNSETER